MPTTEHNLLEELYNGIQDTGIRLERVGGLTVWEAQPVYRHQAAIKRIENSIRAVAGDSGCGCFGISDVSVIFPDGSQKRPDISVFCSEPPEDEQDSAVTLLPDAIIEVISKGFEAKDYDVGVPFYIANGVKDVITLDPRNKEVRHYRGAVIERHVSPVEIVLQCGCMCTV
jgi:Uma2 family endonuclease